jgi:hypothetical protein
MKKHITWFVALLMMATTLFGQDKVKPYQMYETLPLKPKRGQEKQFEEAVKQHNARFHASAPHRASLAVVTEGSGSDGWYFWVMGPCMYSDLDGQPSETSKDHDNDWAANVDPNVDKYGESHVWKYQDSISVTPAGYNPDRLDVWVMDIKPGMRGRFYDLMKKWKGLWEANKYPFSMRVFFNDLWSGSGQDAAIVYSFSKYADFDLDFKWKADYEKMYGENSWEAFWKEWNECVASTSEQLRKMIK